MSNALNWLKKQRRSDLNVLAQAAGYEEYAPGITEQWNRALLTCAQLCGCQHQGRAGPRAQQVPSR
jgi:hypothetical protein